MKEGRGGGWRSVSCSDNESDNSSSSSYCNSSSTTSDMVYIVSTHSPIISQQMSSPTLPRY